ncbi:MAG: hypothetical protein HZB21_05615 [Deltaproteobacteria bacterium]|nr:hypothetical protein [Deltaproteobacteria bacterium]
MNKARQMEVYDDLNSNLSSIRISITKLDYLLDMFVVAGHFEDTTVALITADADRLDKNISGMADNPEYAGLIREDGLIIEGMASISNDWRTIRKVIERLNEAMTTDEAMLIHNAVDTNTILVSETVDRLLLVTAAKRNAVSSEAKMVVLNGILGFLLLFSLAALMLYKNVISPVRKAALTAKEISSGVCGLRFHEGVLDGISSLSVELNGMLDSIALRGEERERRFQELMEGLVIKTSQMDAVARLASLAAESPATNEMLYGAVKEAAISGGASAAGVYMASDGALRLKASYGFDSAFLRQGSAIPVSELNGVLNGRSSTAFFSPLDEYPCRGYAGLLKENGFQSLITVPIRFGAGTVGFLYAAFKGVETAHEPHMPFFEVIAADIGSYLGYSGLFHKEHGQKKFFERVVNQIPLGLAVFEKSGRCLMANNILKRYMGPAPDFDMAGGYNILEDDVMASSGVAGAAMKSCDGFVTESVVNYHPSSAVRYKFSGPQRTFRIRTFPLYDAGGEISSIALLYEELHGAAEAVKRGPA